MESLISALNSMNIAELIAFTLVAYFLVKQPLDKRIDDQNKRLGDLKQSLDKRFDDQNKRFDDLRDLFRSERDLLRSELEAKIKPIEIALNNHITDTTKEIKTLNNRIIDTTKALSDKLDKIISQSKK